MFIDKYRPTNQKSLFHKDIVSHIRKWLISLEDMKSVQKILYLHGPMSCGKTTTVKILLKGYNVIEIDPFDIKSDSMDEILQQIINFRDLTLQNIDKWNNKSHKNKFNIIMIDNTDTSDKNVISFIDTIFKKLEKNIPIICIGNNIKTKELFSNIENCLSLTFNKPSLLELTKLACEINESEKLKMSKDEIKSIIKFVDFDLRQLLHVLQNRKYNPTQNIQEFIETLQKKNQDIDLIDKMSYLTDSKYLFNMDQTFTLSTSEPITISNAIFQNYNNLYLDENKDDILESLEISTAVLDSISWSNQLYNGIYENQLWELYDVFTMTSCVIPSYHIRNRNKELFDINSKLLPYRDVSYNFLNSYNEIKQLSIESMNFNQTIQDNLFSSMDSVSFFKISEIFQICINELCDYFDKNKRKKNTTKQEKIELCKNLAESRERKMLEFIVLVIFNYKLFEVNDDNILIKKDFYSVDENIINNLDKIDIRITKRFINIFSLENTNKIIKSHLESIIKYKLFYKIVEYLDINSEKTKPKTQIEQLTQDLSDLWNI